MLHRAQLVGGLAAVLVSLPALAQSDITLIEFDESFDGYTYGAFSEAGAFSLMPTSVTILANGFGGAGGAAGQDFEGDLYEVRVTARLLPENAAEGFNVVLRDSDGAEGVFEDYQYAFATGDLNSSTFTTIARGVNNPSFRVPGPDAGGTADGDMVRNFGLQQWQIQSQFGVDAVLGLEVQKIELIAIGQSDEVPLLDFAQGFLGGGGFVYDSFSASGAAVFTPDTVQIDATGGGGIGRDLSAMVDDNDAFVLSVRAKLLPGNTAPFFSIILIDDDGDDLSEGTGDEEYAYAIQTSLLNESEFVQVDVSLEDWVNRQQGTFSFFDGDGIVNLGLLQAQVQNPYPGDGEPAQTLAVEVDDVFLTRVEDVPPCIADFNGDEVVNVNDLLSFLGNYRNQNPAADLTGDGNINVSDLLNFLGNYRNGCPA